ncbi:hypothetical protein [Dissulfurispira thermophila]|uniref:hypothetical protein n=1 Tax=Dissulfurispira thermophila TaxID=2715679 RepID=UPI00193C9933|nr:hypothetical protein [Dissulfurispira thermophila]
MPIDPSFTIIGQASSELLSDVFEITGSPFCSAILNISLLMISIALSSVMLFGIVIISSSWLLTIRKP